MSNRIGRYLAVILVCLSAIPGWTQSADIPKSPIVTIDSELIFGSTAVGQSIATNLEARVSDLASENARIASELEKEELELTELRKTLPTDEFRRLAQIFDSKVQRIRREQDNKQRDLQLLRDEERQSFIDAIAPLLSDIARDRGALVVMERRNVLLSADSIDITREVILRIDEVLNNSTDDTPVDPAIQPDSNTEQTGSE